MDRGGIASCPEGRPAAASASSDAASSASSVAKYNLTTSLRALGHRAANSRTSVVLCPTRHARAAFSRTAHEGRAAGCKHGCSPENAAAVVCAQTRATLSESRTPLASVDSQPRLPALVARRRMASIGCASLAVARGDVARSSSAVWSGELAAQTSRPKSGCGSAVSAEIVSSLVFLSFPKSADARVRYSA